MGKKVGRYIQELRTGQSLSIRQLGTQVSLSPAHLSLAENGQREVSITVLFRVVKALHGDFSTALRLQVLDAGIPAEAIAAGEMHQLNQ